MSKEIYLCADELAVSKVKGAVKDLEEALILLNKASYAATMEQGLFELYDEWSGFVFTDSVSTLCQAEKVLSSQIAQLEAFSKLLSAGPSEIENADASFKEILSGPGLWERLGSAWKQTLIYRVSPVLFGIAWTRTLFSPKANTTRPEVEEEQSPSEAKAVLLQSEIDSVISEYDWSRVGVNQEKLTSVVDRASNKEELAVLVQNYYAQKLKERYISQSAPNPVFWGKYYENEEYRSEITDYGCFVSSVSMAFAESGVDILPSEICDINSEYEAGNPMSTHYGSVAASNGFGYSYPSLDEGIINHSNDPEKYTPPIIQIDGWRGGRHYVVVIGKDESGNLIIRDPGSRGDMSTIPANTYIYGTYQFCRR